ncbi:MAG: endoglucanase [Clostridiales bacterium]|nr:endoglucanase [Clostridiales bacterium]
MIPIDRVKYRYRHMPIGGGGYVTGFFFHPADPQVMYSRTDIGGMYRFSYEEQRWISLIDHVSPLDLRETCPISAALDAARPGRLYIASGMYAPDSHGLLSVSEDHGQTFVRHELPFFVHGNLHGRGAGERLLADPVLPDTLWMASQKDGLWISRNGGADWTRVEAFPESGCTFAARIGRRLLVGAEGLALRDGDRRGHSLYLSMDDGASFQPVPQPEYVPVEGSQLHGLVAQRCTSDGQYLYVSFSANGARSQNVERGYTCDCGDCSCGRVARYALTGGGLGEMTDITPEKGNWGFSSVDAKHGLLITATIHRRDGDAIYLSRDGGETWKTILHRLEVGRMDFRLPYMRPECNGGGNLIHWLTNVSIDTHRPNTAWFNTGTGVFRTQNLQAETVIWQDWCDGMEETVHIGVYAPPAGRVQVLDMIGDLGGFAFTDVDRHCDNSFADAEGNRWITCLSCDWPDADPEHIVVAARGNWTGRTKGGLIVSRDGARTWNRLEMPFGLTEELDALLSKISGVNTNAGWVAAAADGSGYVWAVAERIRLHARNVIVSHDGGRTFRRSRVLDKCGNAAQGLMKPLADRVDPRLFYGFGEAGQIYVSTDGGDTFRELAAPQGFPEVNFGLVDCADRTEIRAAAGQTGVLYCATGRGGLWKLTYDAAADELTGTRLSAAGDSVFCVGLGLGRPGGCYADEKKAIYFSGVIGGEYGFYRTLDEGKTLQRINNEKQMYGQIHSIDGDKRKFGRFYIATGSSGLLYGEMEE